MTTCLTVQEWLSARLDGEASPMEVDTVEDHLKMCGPCQCEAERLETLKSVVAQGLESAPVAHPPPWFAARVAARIRPARRWPTTWPALAAAAASVALVAWFLASRPARQELLSIHELKPAAHSSAAVASRAEPPSVEYYLKAHAREASSAPPVGAQGLVEYVGFRR
ncbi:anti-sigma factor [Nitrospinae bacterium AH_259_B05_G02_I21]|nr:anti-sigma factor [Nitrospinae bacterium AH_259_B05_G02_I21]